MSSDETGFDKRQEQTLKFLAGVYGAKTPASATGASYMSGDVPAGTNHPEFWADAPWRVEPNVDHIPMLFMIRGADLQPPAKGPWRFDMLKVEQGLADGSWDTVCAFLPKDLPHVDDKGNVERHFWYFSTEIPLSDLEGVQRGDTVYLRTVFAGSYHPHDKPSPIEVFLQVFLAEHALPQSRAARQSGPRHWFYGDTHYHSGYTNDIKEFGNPVPETLAAGKTIGLDWLVVTDHSCDLDEVDEEVDPGKTRWERLKDDVAHHSSPELRCILGEEITLASKGERYVHMLAFGGLEDMVKGGFLPYRGGFLTKLFQEGLEEYLDGAAESGGFPAGETRRLFGPIHPFEKVLEMLPEKTLTFAAHPYHFAQPPPPGTWHPDDLENLRLTGYEFWNGRVRRGARMTYNPFAKKDWEDPEKLVEKDEARIKKVKAKAEDKWEPALRRGLREWSSADALPARRPVFIAGSDAHGSFNFSVGMGWDYRTRLMVDDNALGRVRTVVHLPGHQANTVPEVDDILAAVKKGSCVVTDGPILEFSLGHQGQVARMGDVLTVSGDGALEMTVVAHTTPEFGPVEQVEVATCFNGRRKPRKTLVSAGESEVIGLNGLEGYCRLFAKTAGQNGERFCCFTNPIWVRITDGKPRHLRVRFASGS